MGTLFYMRKTFAKKHIHIVIKEKDIKLSLVELLKDMESRKRSVLEIMLLEPLWDVEAYRMSLKEVVTAKFHAADANKDGLLDSEELLTFYFPEPHGSVLKSSSQNGRIFFE